MLIAMVMLCASYPSQADPPTVEKAQFAMVQTDPGTTAAQVTAVQDSVSSTPEVTRQWVDPSQLPAKDPAGAFGVGWEWISAILYGIISLVIYFVPTADKWKWLNWIMDVIGFILPNKKKGGGAHSVTLWDLLTGKG